MTQLDILKLLNDIFRDVLDDDSIELQISTTAADVEDWDSLNHIQLIVAIEKKFNIRFTTAEIHTFKNIGDLITAIINKSS
jgi:acyl carrier protein